jgi:Phage terminase, small subunit
MKRWWLSVVEDYELEPHHILILTKAAEAFDRAEGARETIDKEGTTYQDRFGQPTARPEVSIERDSRLQFARLVRELNLSEEPPNAPRPPGLKYGGRR